MNVSPEPTVRQPMLGETVLKSDKCYNVVSGY